MTTMWINWSLLSALLVVIGLVDGRNIEASLEPIPKVVLRGQGTSLFCNYDLHGAPLYMVKWYRGNHEFYRYSPKEPQKKKFFPPKTVPIYVDRSLSNGTQVTLRNLEFAMTGNYSCEVSADSPSFSTAIAGNHVDVVEIPRRPPVIKTEKERYGPGDTLKANCTSYPSRPASNLTFVINNYVMNLATLKVNQTYSGEAMEYSMLEMVVPLTKSHFKTGKMVVRCMAYISPVYAESDTVIFEAPVDPRSERIMSESGTGDGSAKWPSFILVVVGALITLLLNISSGGAHFDMESSFSFEYDAEGEALVDQEPLQNALLAT